MTTSDSPAGARRRLRLAIRKLREATGRTQGQVAENLSWSISKVNRIENGEVTISRTDLQALLNSLGVHDEQEVARLLEDARLSRVKGWWDRPEYRGHLTQSTRQLIQFESEASAIRSFQTAIFPGLLQTREYAEAMIGALTEGVSAETRATRLEVRMLRQENFKKSVPRPKHLVILDEFVLQRIIRSAQVTARQLKSLADAARDPDIIIRLLPKEESIFVLAGSFVIYDIRDEENAILLLESLSTGQFVQDFETVENFRTRFEQMWGRCLTEAASLSVIDARYAALHADLQRYP
ncbi:helix-turn-helix domain-containing protein [Dactylosporangium cerinum]|uniref:Helix-turn-helix domain-containing protein n=1 Tax=Dactylosporangium cerinum TaxID=1434730 RepID=A0ABV9VPX1_9ACTN